jgi:hypothetical protein
MELEDLAQSGPHRCSGLTAAYAGWVHIKIPRLGFKMVFGACGIDSGAVCDPH